jgi:hypothetical protein
MKISHFLVLAVTAAVLAGGVSARAVTSSAPPAPSHNTVMERYGDFELTQFRDRPEADMLRRAYHILETGDHDYKGRRVKAMRAVKAAGDLLGVDLRGDGRDREKQALSDDRLREARGLLENVLGAAEVRDQKRISNHIRAAIKDLDGALKIR